MTSSASQPYHKKRTVEDILTLITEEDSIVIPNKEIIDKAVSQKYDKFMKLASERKRTKDKKERSS